MKNTKEKIIKCITQEEGIKCESLIKLSDISIFIKYIKPIVVNGIDKSIYLIIYKNSNNIRIGYTKYNNKEELDMAFSWLESSVDKVEELDY